MIQKDYIYLVGFATILVWTSPSIFLIGVLVWLMKDSVMIKGCIHLLDDRVQEWAGQFQDRKQKLIRINSGICQGTWKNGSRCTYRAVENGRCRRHFKE